MFFIKRIYASSLIAAASLILIRRYQIPIIESFEKQNDEKLPENGSEKTIVSTNLQ